MWNDKHNLIGLLSITGAFVMALSIFLYWGAYDLGPSTQAEFTGWGIISGNMDRIQLESAVGPENIIDVTEYDSAAWIVLVGGILGFVTAVVRLSSNDKRVANISGTLTIIVSIAAIVTTALLIQDLNTFEFMLLSTHAEYGTYVAIVGAVLSILGCVGAYFKKPLTEVDPYYKY